jgi:hypothetical protein
MVYSATIKEKEGGIMRMARLKLETAATYHAMSRIVGGQFLMGDVEKDYLRQEIRRV